MKSFDIMFSDLTAEAQERYLKFQGVSDESELNWEVMPLATIDREEEECDLKNDMIKQINGEPHLQ
jgi:hypothetical protein